jgi:hypothetical protein
MVPLGVGRRLGKIECQVISLPQVMDSGTNRKNFLKETRISRINTN